MLVAKKSQKGRVYKEIYKVVNQPLENNVSIFIQFLGLDTGAKTAFQKSINNIFLTIMSEFAQLETVQLSDRIKSGMEEAKKKIRL